MMGSMQLTEMGSMQLTEMVNWSLTSNFTGLLHFEQMCSQFLIHKESIKIGQFITKLKS